MGGGGGGSSDAGGNADRIQARITREQWDHFTKTFAPLEGEIRQNLGKNVATYADKARREADMASATMSGANQRAISRSGVEFGAEQAGEVSKRIGLNSALNSANAYNRTMRLEGDKRTDDYLSYVALGKDIASSSSNMANQAASMKSARDQQYAANKNAAAQQRTSLIASGVGLAAALIT